MVETHIQNAKRIIFMRLNLFLYFEHIFFHALPTAKLCKVRFMAEHETFNIMRDHPCNTYVS